MIFGEKTSIKVLICCSIIISGFMVGAEQENESGKDKPTKKTTKHELTVKISLLKCLL
jgi:hypothetical protein